MTEFPIVKLEIYIPPEYVEKLGDALSEIGAGRVGNYDHCMSFWQVTGHWRPLPGANPYQGEVGQLETGQECKVEMNCPWEMVPEALKRIKAIHPYEEPLIQIVPLLNHRFETR